MIPGSAVLGRYGHKLVKHGFCLYVRYSYLLYMQLHWFKHLSSSARFYEAGALSMKGHLGPTLSLDVLQVGRLERQEKDS